MPLETRVTAIVPAYNEEGTVADVLRPLKRSGLFSQIIVVSDGSTDKTAEVARAEGVTVYETPNGGKGKAMAFGLAHASTPIVSFFDADLRGLTAEHVRVLVTPVLEGKRAMNAGLRDRGPFFTWLEGHLPLIGGERAMLREVFESIPAKYMQGFMVEASLNFYCRANKLPYGGTVLEKLSMRRKYEKVGWIKALGQYVHMFYQVFSTMLLVRLHRSEFISHATHDKHGDRSVQE